MKVWTARISRQAGAIAAIGTAGALLLPGTAAVAGTKPAAHGRVVVPQGIGAAVMHGSKALRPAAASSSEQVSFVLQAQNLTALEARVSGGMSGGYLSVGAFASKYGLPAADITQLTTYLHTFSITTSVDADHLDLRTTGTVADYNSALGITQDEFHARAVPAAAGQPGRPAVTFRAAARPATLPTQLAPFVLSVLGLTSYPAGFSSAVHRPALAAGVTAPRSTVQKGNLKPSSFASRYQLSSLTKKGAKGQHRDIGIVTLASMRASDATHFWSKDLKIKTAKNRIALTKVDGGSGKVSNANGSGETTLDVEQSGALAPDAHIIVYEAPNTDAGFLDGFAEAASQNKASVVSSSWGESETAVTASVAAQEESSTYAQAFDEIFLELAAQGQTSFVASGDSGAYDASADVGSTDLSVDEPGSSPWITDAGGMTLTGKIPVSATRDADIKYRRAWGWDWLWPFWKLFSKPGTKTPYPSEAAFAFDNVAGDGGGYSVAEATPAYQSGAVGVSNFHAVQYLTPIDPVTTNGLTLPTKWSFTAKPAVTAGTATGRAVPDVAANADPFTGYEEYFTGFPGKDKLETGWGGTSFVAPQFAGAAAVIDSYLGHRTGFWNPAIYKFASYKHSPFSPVDRTGTSNDNLYFTGTAGARFNPGTGLGSPDFTRLADDFHGA